MQFLVDQNLICSWEMDMMVVCSVGGGLARDL